MGNCNSSADVAVVVAKDRRVVTLQNARIAVETNKPTSASLPNATSWCSNSSNETLEPFHVKILRSLATTPVEHSLRRLMTRDGRQRDLTDFYDKLEVIGVGSMGSVVKVQKREEEIGGSARILPVDRVLPARQSLHKKTPYTLQYALKTILLDRVGDPAFIQELKNEIEVLKSCDHPNIVKAIETFEYDSQISFLMELCSGGDLYSRDPYTEAQARRIIRNLTSAVAYMHRCGIVHRDIKYENILFESNHPNAEIKLIDFGISRKYLPGETHFQDSSGTMYSMAPEVLKKDYNSQADLWSVGVVAFMALTSTKPFTGANTKELLQAILSCYYSFSSPRWDAGNSLESKSFVSALLVKDPEKRPTGGHALRHPWLDADFREQAQDMLNGNVVSYSMQQIKDSLLRYAGYSKLKKLALMILAHKSTCTEIGESLRNTFQKFDFLRNSTICLEELEEVMSRSFPDLSNQDIAQLFEDIDLDGSGLVHYTEFLAATIELCGPISEERLAEAFDRIDSDDTGFITTVNIKEFISKGFMRREFSEEYAAEVIDESDLTRDGVVSYDEFLALFSRGSLLESSLKAN